MKKTIREIVRNATNVSVLGCPSEGWPPENLRGFAYWLEYLADTIPRECFAEARIVFTGGHEEDEQMPVRVVVSYTRPETDAEEQVREDSEHVQQIRRERARQQNAHLFIAEEIKHCNAEQKRALLDLLKKECGE